MSSRVGRPITPPAGFPLIFTAAALSGRASISRKTRQLAKSMSAGIVTRPRNGSAAFTGLKRQRPALGVRHSAARPADSDRARSQSARGSASYPARSASAGRSSSAGNTSSTVSSGSIVSDNSTVFSSIRWKGDG